MRLLSCYIENFGKISQQEFSFTEGLNTFCEDNGWGKSTLVSFLKVMLFGFADEGRRDELLNERKRFRPWQGGVYGGSLVFAVDEKIYRISRTFGIKSKEDIFLLYEEATGLESRDFSSNIGEELFLIDRDSFCRTVYISQEDCATVATDKIHAKIGNLAEDTKDMNHYEDVMKRLSDQLNEMSPSRKTGSISRRTELIYEMENRVKRIPELDEAIRVCMEQLEEEKKKKVLLKTAQEEIQAELQRMSGYQDLQVKQERYQNLMHQLKESGEKLSAGRSFFRDGVPEPEKLQSMNQKVSRLSKLQMLQAQNHFSQEEEERLACLDEVFGSGVPECAQVDALLADWSVRSEKKNVLNTKKAALQAVQQVAGEMLRHQKRKAMPVLFTGLLLILAGVAGCFWNLLLGLAAVPGVLLGIWGLVLWKRSENGNDDFQKQQEHLEELRAELLADERFIQETDQKMHEFLERYHLTVREHETMGQLYSLKNQIQEYASLSARKTRCEEQDVSGEICALSTEIEQFLEPFGSGQQLSAEQMSELLQEIRLHLQSLQESRTAYDALCHRREQFEAENDMEALNRLEPPDEGAFEKMNRELEKITDSLEMVITHISDYNKRVDLLQQERDDCGEEAEQLVLLREEVAKDRQRYEQLTLTRDYLEKAKESFTARYRTPVKNSYDKYYEQLTGISAKNYQIDANIHLTVEEQGLQRNVQLLSTGYRDLTGICLRMALIDAMYQEEKPFVIFDDPFTNLDAEKIQGGLKFLQEIAKEYQVIYATCHSDRNPV